MALMCLSPLSGSPVASFPQVLESSCLPPVPKPILDSQELHWLPPFPWPRMPILALEYELSVLTTLIPCSLHSPCKEACGPTSFFHALRLIEVARCWPSAISEYRELASLLSIRKLICSPIFITTQILVKDVFQ